MRASVSTWLDWARSLFRGQLATAGSGAVIIQVQGFWNRVYLRDRPHLQLTQYGGLYRRIEDDPETGGPREIDVVQPFTRAIELVGRDAELGALWDWLQSDSRISVRVLTGDSGLGKTRLALELVDRLKEKGWRAGFLEPEELDRFLRQEDIAAWGWNKPVFIVADDASAMVGGLNRLLERLAGHGVWDEKEEKAAGSQPLRVLLLERHATPGKGWWAATFEGAEAVKRMLDPPEPVTLQPLAEPVHRRHVLELARTRLGRDAARLEPRELERILATTGWGGVPLLVMMAGAAMTGGNFGAVLALGARELVVAVAERELRRIRNVVGVDADLEPFVDHMVAVATLRRGLTEKEALAAIEAEAAELRYELPMGAAALLNALARALPGDREGVGAVGPDMIGEALVLAVWSGNDRGSTAIRRAYRSDPAAVVDTVVRACQDYRGVDRTAPHEPFEATPLEWLETIVDACDDRDELMQLASAIPEQTVQLRESAVGVWRSIVDLIEPLARETERAQMRGTFASCLGNLSIRLSAVGREREALAAVEEAVALHRSVAASDDAFLPDLATSLNNLASCLSRVGRHAEGLRAAQQNHAIVRDLASSSGGGRSDLAFSLNNLSFHLGNANRPLDALAAAEESVSLYRELLTEDPGAHRLGLARSLDRISLNLSSLDRHEEAYETREESVSILRQLTSEDPGAFRPDLARSLNNLSWSLSRRDRNEEALVASEEAVELFRNLLRAAPGAFAHSLATALRALSARLSSVGRHDDALSAIEEAVSIARGLFVADPELRGPDLAASLHELQRHLSRAGRHEEALTVNEKAVAIRRDLTSSNPGIHGRDLALSLQDLVVRLSRAGRHEEALAAGEEAVAICRDLVQTDSATHRSDLASSLRQVQPCLSRIGRHEEALAAIAEAVAIYRDLVQADSETHLPDLATSLYQLQPCLSQAGRHEEALAVNVESVSIWRGLAVAAPERYRPGLASSLQDFGVDLSQAGRHEEALAAVAESVSIWR
ncbi:MAG: tetratricopeptide repeat protein, partial [Holophagales bacterium]|nr:tetratricopeptide repeat protein [Holophagales bacterium]